MKLEGALAHREKRQRNIHEDGEAKNQLWLDRFKRFLVKEGIAWEKDGHTVVDLEKVLAIKGQDLQDKVSEHRPEGMDLMTSLVEVFRGHQVFSTDDEARIEAGEEVDPKPLFYEPASSEDALDIEKIRASEFYLSLSDFKNGQRYQASLHDLYQSADYPFESAELALHLYHPRYGDGRRDENGKLLIRRGEQREYARVTKEWIAKESGVIQPASTRSDRGTKVGFWQSHPDPLSTDFYKPLSNSGLLRTDDFGTKAPVREAQLQEQMKKIGKRGSVFVAKGIYTLGTEHEGKFVKKIDGNRYGIFDESGTMTHWFSPVSEQVMREVREKVLQRKGKVTGADMVISKKLIEIHPAGDPAPEQPSEQPLRLFRRSNTVNKTGIAPLGEISVSLGREYTGSEVVELSKGIFGVVKDVRGRKNLTQWFCVDPEMARTKQEESERRFRAGSTSGRVPPVFSLSRGEIALQPYTEGRRNEILPGESPEDYADRIRALASVEELKKFGDDMSKEAGAPIHELDYREQQWLASYAYSETGRYERLIKFAKTYKLEGLRAFLATEYGFGLGDNILSMAETSDEAVAKGVLAKYGDITKMVQQVRSTVIESIRADINEEQIKRIIRFILQKGKATLEEFVKTGTTSDYQRIQEMSEEVILFGALCSVAGIDRDFSFEKMKDARVSIDKAGALSEADKSEMISLFRRSRQQHDTAGMIQKDLATLQSRLNEQAETTSVFRLFYKDHLVAFMRIDQEQDGSLHVGSLNSRPDAAGSGIGMAFLQVGINKAARDRVVKAEVALTPFLIENYVNRFGFEIYGVDVDSNDDDVSLLIKIDHQAMKEAFIDQKHELEFDFSNPQDRERVKTELKELFASGYVVRHVSREGKGSKRMRFAAEHVVQPQKTDVS